MNKRIELQYLLEEVLGSKHVYFQPPASKNLEYPAIVYSRNSIDNNFADDSVYMQEHSYEVIVIDSDPDSEIVSKVSKLPMCRHSRHYKSNNLNHDAFTLYY